MPHDLHVEIAVALEQFLGVVVVTAGIEDGQRAAAEQRMNAALPRIQQHVDLRLRQHFEAAARPYARVNDFRQIDNGFQEWLSVPFRAGYRWACCCW